MASYSYAFTTVEDPVSDSGALTAGPGAWGNMQATGGRGRPSVLSTYCAAMLDTTADGGTSIGSNQRSQIKIFDGGGTDHREGGPTTRHQSTTDGDGYMLDTSWKVLSTAIYRVADTGSLGFTQLGAAFTFEAVSGDTIKLESNGSTHEYFLNGVSKGTRSDATYTGGQPGFFAYNVVAGMFELDDFLGEDLGGGAATVIVPGYAGGLLMDRDALSPYRLMVS